MGAPEESGLSKDIAAFDAMRAELEMDHNGKWIVIHDRELVGDYYDEFEQAAEFAVEKFGGGPYLIRQVGAPIPRIPASVLLSSLQPSSTAT